MKRALAGLLMLGVGVALGRFDGRSSLASVGPLIAYLTSTSNFLQPSEAWALVFRGISPQGLVTTTAKSVPHFLRAVRGGF